MDSLQGGMGVKIEPAARVRDTFALPGDEPVSHRAAIRGAMADGETLAE